MGETDNAAKVPPGITAEELALLLEHDLVGAFGRAVEATHRERDLEVLRRLNPQEVARSKRLSDRVGELEEALLFYADPDTYFAIGMIPDRPCGALMEDWSIARPVYYDGGHETCKPGKRARTALGIEQRECEEFTDA